MDDNINEYNESQTIGSDKKIKSSNKRIKYRNRLIRDIVMTFAIAATFITSSIFDRHGERVVDPEPVEIKKELVIIKDVDTPAKQIVIRIDQEEFSKILKSAADTIILKN